MGSSPQRAEPVSRPQLRHDDLRGIGRARAGLRRCGPPSADRQSDAIRQIKEPFGQADHPGPDDPHRRSAQLRAPCAPCPALRNLARRSWPRPRHAHPWQARTRNGGCARNAHHRAQPSRPRRMPREAMPRTGSRWRRLRMFHGIGPPSRRRPGSAHRARGAGSAHRTGRHCGAAWPQAPQRPALGGTPFANRATPLRSARSGIGAAVDAARRD